MEREKEKQNKMRVKKSSATKEALRLRFATFTRKVNKRHKTVLLNREEYGNIIKVPYYNSEKTENGKWIAKDHLLKEGQVHGIPVNKRPDEEEYRVLWDWETFEVMRRLQFETIEVHIWELEEEEERMLYTELAFPMEKLPDEIVTSMLQERVSKAARLLQEEEDKRTKEREEALINRDKNYEKRDRSKDIVYDRIKLPPADKKLNRKLLDKVKEKYGIMTDHGAQRKAYLIALKAFNQSK